MKTYGFNETLRLTGATKNNLIWWKQQGVFRPYREGIGRGDRDELNFENLIQVVIARELNRFGVPVAEISKVLLDLKVLDDKVPSSKEDLLARWRRYRNPTTRLNGWTADLLVAYEGDTVSAMIFVGPKEDRGKASAVAYLTISLETIISEAEQLTGDHWEPVGVEEAFEANRRLERATAEQERIDRLCALRPDIALDRRLRAELGLPSLKYDNPRSEVRLLTLVDAKRIKRERLGRPTTAATKKSSKAKARRRK